ncbi:MAG: four helix bundle protein [Phycisphaerae bacterium]|nr:four helix bundle protein [Phycisphaerae bacterium]
METLRSYKDLVAWQKAVDLVEYVYRLSGTWPQEERFGLVSQIRRAAVSVCANIAEGFGRSRKADYLRFLDIAAGSANETETHMVIADRLGFADAEEAERAIAATQEVQRIIRGLIRSIRNSSRTNIRPK